MTDLLKTIAPWLGTAIGGPLGGLAVEAIGSALGLSDKTESAIKSALQGVTPEQLQAVKEAEASFAIKMQELGFKHESELESIAAADRDSARKREMEVKDHTPRNLAYALTCGFFLVVLLMFFVDVPSSTRDLLNILLGMLGTSFSSVMNYFYGSTSGSKLKTEILAKNPANK